VLFDQSFLCRPLTDDVPDTRYQRGDQREQRRDIHLGDLDPPPLAPPETPLASVTVPGCTVSQYGRSNGGIELLSAPAGQFVFAKLA
jgi:hypothetical protein